MEQNIIISATGMYVPDNKVYNEYFVEHFNRLGLKSEGLMTHLGRRKRYLATEKDNSLTMAYEACKNALSKIDMEAMALDLVVFVSDTPEYNMPTNALKLVNMLEAGQARMVFDMNSNCTGMLTGMDIVAGYMKNKPDLRKALVVGSFHISSVARDTDTVVYPNFADAAAAVILEKREEERTRGLLDSEVFTDASYESNVTLPKCGYSKIRSAEVEPEQKRLEWNPFDFSFLSDQWTSLIRTLLMRHGLTPEQIDYYVFSQLSDPDNMATLKKLGVSEEKYFFLGKEYGYTGNTCPILVLNRMWDVIAARGNKVVFCSVGAGYSIIALLYEF